MLEGVATPSDDVAEMLPSSRDSGGRLASGDRGELLVRITPTRLGGRTTSVIEPCGSAQSAVA